MVFSRRYVNACASFNMSIYGQPNNVTHPTANGVDSIRKIWP